MTVISEPVGTIAGADNSTQFEFWSPVLRESADGTGTITARPHFLTPVDGVLTTPDLDPGPASVRIGQRVYRIEIPDDPAPVRLWPLIEAGLPVAPAEESTAVRNFGGVPGLRRVTQSWYAANPHDPDTLYVVVPD
ncbi:hypothetical protein IU501_10980 [Nocardia otitidiscaviarum]|uniref:hypothetical protein n=1 Tax=Nocardia otitidiscaviarum TaxID=1823 RepID=UPI001895C7DC|nr:hypothetical protein [Nocardia otitidiscaviarum]MBF6133523.1 hypothetical protein [Nocardia otitidiscaviarum]